LYLACLQGDVEIAQMLLAAKATIDCRTDTGMTPLLAAVDAYDNGSVVLSTLLDAGADPNLADWDGLTPLMEAAQHGRADAVWLLLRHGADPTRLNRSGNTARTLAERGQYWRVAAMLSTAKNRRQV
jgi:hypothetical protein